MKRHPALRALSDDHHHALVQARRLRRAAAAPEPPDAAAAIFVEFFNDVTVPHFREEEETVFPLVADDDAARPLLVQALLDHQQLHRLAAVLEDGGELRGAMAAAGELLDEHVRREERELFPLIERLAADELQQRPRAGSAGPVWGTASDDLNATLLAWPPEQGPGEQVNEERDVLVHVVEGSATLVVDGEETTLRPGAATIVAKGTTRKLTAGPHGVRYLSVHLRRPPLQIAPSRGAA
ncbi:MAG TPA: hemerythrin domain-containing protein [Gaiellaceae bacterium]|nr:hemerythrin domain-containing protein [Gaiellaceae bacterium]